VIGDATLSPPGASRARRLGVLALVGLASLAGLVAFAPRASGDDLTLALPSRIAIEGGFFVRGSHDADLRFAIELCEREIGLRGRQICRDPAVSELFAAEAPARRIWVRSFAIDRTEVTRAAYHRCVRAGLCAPSRVSDADPRLGRADHPVVGVTWHDASAFCEFAGGHLPSEAEWERAARGADGRRFPWGNLYNDRLANHGGPEGRAAIDGHRYLAPVGSFPSGASPHGLLDVAGNVWEWTADRFDLQAYVADAAVDPRHDAATGERTLRGGSWRSTAESLRVTTRRPAAEGAYAPDVGFRCAYGD
jgi:formylglycine-generating enzyme required for sulfatase activity